ncbi:hypothetical protein [Anabaena subtropica]|uniref:Uncharacterized protein n=1 Tax=Anabaena subtropica FACHB-260 TaxID=2692884 RepID=A0ABR8CPM4_9NOST|nr:hypothetical protein [Anabaena subtropica]MBD2344994.1 hypothetical protein [Anabaena subtropica FACHB-260]
MAIIKRTSLNTSLTTSEQLAQKNLEEQRMRDVRLLLQNLFESEAPTIKLILDCLYDVGSVNIINQKFRYRPLNRVIKSIARMSKPVFRIFAWRWFKNNCSQLAANWLYSQVAFEVSITRPPEIAVEVSEIQQPQQLQAENLSREVKYLRHQVRLLTGITIVALSALGLAVITFSRNTQEPLQTREQFQSTIYR